MTTYYFHCVSYDWQIKETLHHVEEIEANSFKEAKVNLQRQRIAHLENVPCCPDIIVDAARQHLSQIEQTEFKELEVGEVFHEESDMDVYYWSLSPKNVLQKEGCP